MKKSLSVESEHQSRSVRPDAKILTHTAQTQGIINNRVEAIAQRQMIANINASSKMVDQRKTAASFQFSPRSIAQRKQYGVISDPLAQLQAVPEEELLQGRFETAQRMEEEELLQGRFSPQDVAQLKEPPADKPNKTGLPDNLKNGIEALSGISMDSVKVHYNSNKPAQLNALAYAQGTEIHVASGQERHLPHEAWHVVQQAQGRVQPTMLMNAGIPVNDDLQLENEADLMGAKAVAQQTAMSFSSDAIGVRRMQQLQSLSDSVQLSPLMVAQLQFDAGNGAQWHIHYGHIKLGKNNNSRVDFNGRDKKDIRKELGEKIARYGLNVAGDLSASFRECIDYINSHF
ncbi:protein of unknown function [Nitrosomonas aestuarii]|uniref:eCIS core domain-containing protein n=1 Tax=Nitrosomonas aestuarii TaxID=52441 RepID=A0A1I4ES40_9PROT|nr:DUF4157 domain-containing protein [Nitrosomonas aestuarii]SFL08119.1 protein of unknown function [Nitrosomonas aestuarii]